MSNEWIMNNVCWPLSSFTFVTDLWLHINHSLYMTVIYYLEDNYIYYQAFKSNHLLIFVVNVKGSQKKLETENKKPLWPGKEIQSVLN